MLLTILSGLFGGLLRLAPEILSFFDKKNDRQHELAMQDKALEFQKLTGTQKIEEITSAGEISIQQAQLDAYAKAYASQSEMAVAGGKTVAAISALVRPVVTFFIFTLWAVFKVCVLIYAWQQAGNLVDTILNTWNQDDAAMLSMILSFWFVGRAMEKKR